MSKRLRYEVATDADNSWYVFDRKKKWPNHIMSFHTTWEDAVCAAHALNYPGDEGAWGDFSDYEGE